MLKKPILALLLGAFPMVHAQAPHFDGMKWREKETDHFLIRSHGTSSDPASKLAEKVWVVCLDVLPELKDDFEKNEFRTPSGDKGAEAAPFRYSVYLVEDGAEFRHLVDIDAGRNGWDANQVRLTNKVGNYAEPQCRYGVFCKGDPEQSRGGRRDVSPVFVHSTGAALLRGRCLTASAPFWMRAGFGYYVEHMIFDLCRVHYLDFESYYRDNESKFTKGETLGPDKDWPSVLRKLCKDEKRSSLQDVLNAQIITLTPQESGYIFALTYFLVRDEEAQKNYRKLVEGLRDGETIDADAILEAYGYTDAASLETEWYEWMESRQFK
ncbi:MAG: hypothetical protein ACPG4K_02165 [Haloferula sp.]